MRKVKRCHDNRVAVQTRLRGAKMQHPTVHKLEAWPAAPSAVSQSPTMAGHGTPKNATILSEMDSLPGSRTFGSSRGRANKRPTRPPVLILRNTLLRAED